MKTTPFQEYKSIKENYCIGCGVCSAITDVKIYFDEHAKYNVCMQSSGNNNIEDLLSVCPFSSKSNIEETFSREYFPKNFSFSKKIGFFLENYIGFVKDDTIRLKSSSGGIITWLLIQLLRTKQINNAAYVGKSKNKDILFEYNVTSDENDIINGASSKYYPVELSSILEYIRMNDGKYVIVALPCFTKAIRLLQKKDKIFKERIKFIISPICGHLKTANYSKFLAWQTGINPNELLGINFRNKIIGKLASQYGTEFIYAKNDEKKYRVVENSSFKMGTDWGHGMFKYPACDYCDDVVGEMADISVGDAWLQEYNTDFKGYSVIVVRNEFLNDLLLKGNIKDDIELIRTSEKNIIKSQSGGFRHKRDDLKFRLWLKQQKNEWFPLKRIIPSDSNIGFRRKKIIKMRLEINILSHNLFLEAVKKNNLKYFYKRMLPLLDRYYLLYNGIVRFIIHKIKKIVCT